MKTRREKALEKHYSLSNIFLFLGLGLGLAGGMFLFMGMFMGFAIGGLQASTLVFLGVCCPISFLPGAACAVAGFILRRKAARLKDLADMLVAYRRIEISDLSRKLGQPEIEVERDISRCISSGLVEGYFDRRSGEFFTPESLMQELKISNCPHCMAPVDKVVLIGERIECSYCKSLIQNASEWSGAGRKGN